jgi:hypothetical protein
MNVVDRPGRPPLSPREGWISDGRQVAWMAAQQEQAGCVISGIGSLSVVQLRLAGQQESTTITGDLGVCRKTQSAGTFSPGESWLVADFSAHGSHRGWIALIGALFDAFAAPSGHTPGQAAVHATSSSALSRLPRRIRL